MTDATTNEIPQQELSSPSDAIVAAPLSPPKPYLAAAKSASSKAPVTDVVPQVVLWNPSSNRLDPRCDTLSSATSHDRMETMSNLTSHQEIESVVSSWAEDDDYFIQSALHDIQVTEQQQAALPGKGWKVASANGRRGNPQRKSRRPGGARPTSPTGVNGASGPSSAVSGGRFDALATETKRRR